jgi:two-component system, sensor histidine kinase YesM
MIKNALHFRSGPSRKKMVTLYGLFIFVSMLMLGGYMVGKFYNNSLVDTNISNERVVNQTTENISQSFQIIKNTMIGLSAGEYVSTWYNYVPLEKESVSFFDYKKSLDEEIRYFLTYNSAWQYDLLSYVSVFINHELTTYIYTKSYPVKDITNNSITVYSEYIKESQEYVQIIPPSEKRQFLYFSRKIKEDFDSSSALVMIVCTSEQDISAKYESLVAGSQNLVFITDSDNRIYSSNRKDLLGTRITPDLMNSFQSDSKGVQHCLYNGEEYIFYRKPIESTSLFFSYLIPKAHIIKKNRIEVQGYIIAAVFLTILMVGAGVFLSAKNSLFVKELVQDSFKSEIMLKDMKIKSLQHQMNPHFLFNILLVLQIRAKKSSDETLYKMISSLSHLLRGGIYGEKIPFITIEKELQYVEFYLYLQEQRFGEKLKYSINIEEGLNHCVIPRLSIEPIVENAVIHGVENNTENVQISINVISKRDELSITIEDNGCGFDVDNVREELEPREKIGLNNTEKRIKLIYGNEYGLNVSSQIGQGTKVIMTIPRKESSVDNV